MSGNAAAMASSIEIAIFFIIDVSKSTFTVPHVSAPGIMAAMVQIVKVALVGIGLPLKGDIAVGIATHR